MSPKEAKRVLDLLANGIDPTTGEMLPSEHVLNSPTVIRALFLGAQALDSVPSKPAKPGAGPQAGKPWSNEEESRLAEAFDKGASIDELSQAHGRSKGGIAARLVRLGKIDERSEVYVREPRSEEGGLNGEIRGGAREV